MRKNKHPSRVPDDIDEARAIRAGADANLAKIQSQAPYVARLTARLIQRRAENHFGDSITVTFSPKGTNV
jgi:hypothetical protein